MMTRAELDGAIDEATWLLGRVEDECIHGSPLSDHVVATLARITKGRDGRNYERLRHILCADERWKAKRIMFLGPYLRWMIDVARELIVEIEFGNGGLD